MTAILRAANPLDAGSVARILTDFATATPWMPRLHTGAEDVAFAGRMIDQGWVTVADADGVCGFIALRNDQVLSLYIHHDQRGQGLGKALLDRAKHQSPRLNLWTFQQNDGAQRFYLREGFAEVRRTDGQNNEENLPDIELLWEREATA